jgi:hypothetical protein
MISARLNMFASYAIVDMVIRPNRYMDYNDSKATNGNIHFSVKNK